MKRVSKLYNQICTLENLKLADKTASAGKAKQYGVIAHIKNRDANIVRLNDMLVNKTYKTSPYKNFTIYEPKERLISALNYFPDRITHHAIMNIMEPLFVSWFTADTYSCIKGRGIHAASYALRNALRNEQGTRYCLKLDIKKFYPSIMHYILKAQLRRKIKDNDLLWLLDEIIDSAPGVPIGNYLSQYFANFYLTPFDHWIKQRVKYYFRYADDMVILADNKPFLHYLRHCIQEYLHETVQLQVKENYQVFPVAARGIDYLGYVHYHDKVLVRKSIKQAFARKLAAGNYNPLMIASYKGWLQHANAIHLTKTLLTPHAQFFRHEYKGPAQCVQRA